jgi:uncharacterized protein YdhG (YjbR/CyaY superfamily)
VGAVDEWLAGLDDATRQAFSPLVALAQHEVPTAEQGVSYGMPALRYRGKPLVGFAAATHHLSLFPFSPTALDAVRDQLDGYSLSKGTIRFSAQSPLPEQAVRDLLRTRADEIDASLTRPPRR